MLSTTKNTTLTGKSEIETSEGSRVIVATMTAVLSETGGFNSSKTVVNAAYYEIYKDEVQADFKAFDDLAYALSNEEEV